MEKVKSMLVDNKNIGSPKDVYKIVSEYLDGVDREHLVLLTLDTKNKITSISTICIGSLNASVVHPREVFKPAILSNAASIILAHNHPSGDLLPSKADTMMTDRMNKLCELMGIPLIDHVIVG